ncbi:MAG: peptidase [Erysipelotrichaceae bacterium]|nr:peptidase [Erysipelotrichaceae bacterium]
MKKIIITMASVMFLMISGCGSGQMDTGSTDNSTAAENAADKTGGQQEQTADNEISEEEALRIALAAAGLKETDVKITKREFDVDHGIAKYEFEFWHNDEKYEFEIDTAGVILSRSKEYTVPADTAAAEKTPEGFISREEALAIALKHAGVSENDIFKVEIKLDNEHGRDEYDIEFHAGGKEYSYDINAQSGEITGFESEIDD